MNNRVGRRDFLRRGTAGLAGGGLAAVGLAISPQRALARKLADLHRWLEIVRIDRTTVRLPFRETSGRNMARELPHWAWTEVVEVTLKSGHVGFGETLLYYTWGATGDDDVGRVQNRNASEWMWHDELGAGLQMALFDAVAKAAEVPLHRLLGHQVHQRTSLAWWNIDTSPEDMASECSEAYRQGYRSYKTKGRPWIDAWRQAELSAKAVPDSFKLAIDFNDTLLDAERGIPILKEMEQYPQVAIWETPIPQSDIAGNQAIRRECRAPVAMHFGTPEPRVAIKEEVCDGFVIGGGASRVKSQGAVAEMAGLPFWLQLVGTGITAAWSLHFGAVLKNATWPAVNCHQLYQHDLLTNSIELTDGYASIPDGPGLGYGLDKDTVARFRVEKPTSRPDPPRLIETSWQDGRRMYFANTGYNFMIRLGQAGKIPYFERGVTTKLIPNDGSSEWRRRYDRAMRGAFLE